MKIAYQSIFSIGLILISFLSFAQNQPTIRHEVKGTILDGQTSAPLIGATVTIKGTTNGGTTDENGEFLLRTGQTLPFTLVISYVGYQKKRR